MEEQHYNCAICWIRLLWELKVQGNICFSFLLDMLVLVRGYLCEKSAYIIFENFWSAQPTNECWLAIASEWNETQTAPGIFRDSDKCDFCAREKITKCIMVLSIQSHNTVVSQSAPIADCHCLKKVHFMASVVPRTLSLIFPIFYFFFFFLTCIIFLLLHSKTEGLWRLKGIKVQPHISWPGRVTMEIIPVVTGPSLTASLHSLLPSPTLLALNNTRDDSVISWLYSQIMGLSATFRSPLFFF